MLQKRLPLNGIGTEQKQKIERLPGTKPVHITAETITSALLRDLHREIYTYSCVARAGGRQKVPPYLNQPRFQGACRIGGG